MWSRSAGSQVGRPRSVVPAARPSTTKTGPTVARKKAGSRKPAARRPNVLAGGHFSKNYHNDGVEVINIIPLRQMEGFLKSFLDLSHVSVWCRGSRVAVFEKWEELSVCHVGRAWSPLVRPNNDGKVRKKKTLFSSVLVRKRL